MKKICIIYTGGTIGMVPTENGFAPQNNFLEKVLDGIQDLHDASMPMWDLIEFDNLLDSSNIAVHQWMEIGQTIKDNYYNYDGFVVLHGTDTLAYTASVLSFILENLSKPVIITGSQIPLCQIRSDGRENLISSLLLAADGIANEVTVYFGGKLLRGNRATKVSADNLLAFDSPNYPALAQVGIEVKYNEGALRQVDKSLELGLVELRMTSIGVLKIFPGIQFDLFKPIMTHGLSAIVLETFGSGNIPDSDGKLLPLIKEAADNSAVLVVCSQCLQGTVKLGAYAASGLLVRDGAISGYDMTTEAAVSKLYYLFSKGLSVSEIKTLMETNIRGELTE